MTKKSQSLNTAVRKYLEKYPNAKAQVVAEATGATPQYVHNIRYMDKKNVIGQGDGLEQKDNKWKPVAAWTASKSIRPEVTDMVNHPPHYKMGGIETIDFIEAKGFGYNLGNVVKYISRADHKGSHYEDLCKARWYLNREIAKYTPQEIK